MKLSIQEIIKIYHEVKSIRKTATLSGYSKSGVEYLLKKNNIKLFSKNRNGDENSSRKAIENLNINDPRKLVRDPIYMFELYVQNKMSIPEIANKLQISNTTVITGLNQCGIKRRSKKEALKGKSRPNVQGSKNINWRGGITGWRKLARGRLNEHFVKPIMERDNFNCQWCFSKKNIVVHHHVRSFMEIVNIVRQRINELNIEDFVNEIVKEHKLKDGITICKICHDNFHKEHGK